MARRDHCKPGADVSGTRLCRVRRVNGEPIRKGTILARYGAWQRKYLVEYVTYLGIHYYAHEHSEGGDYHVWAVGVRNLGEFYADGRVYRSRSSKITELWHATPVKGTNVHTREGFGIRPPNQCYDGLFGGYGGGFHPVEPVEDPEKKLELISFKRERPLDPRRAALARKAQKVTVEDGCLVIRKGRRTMRGHTTRESLAHVARRRSDAS